MQKIQVAAENSFRPILAAIKQLTYKGAGKPVCGSWHISKEGSTMVHAKADFPFQFDWLFSPE